MVKAEWGTKRTCQACSVRYYDFNRSPVLCPACGVTFEADVSKTRRTRTRAVAAEPAAEVVKDEAEAVEEVEAEKEADAAVDVEVVAAEADTDTAALEDTDELGDDDVVEEVIAETDVDDEDRNT